MLVNLDDVLFWLDAVRNSSDRYRTLESFWKGQIRSKLWLIENLEKIIQTTDNKIVIHGGWNGVLASLLFNSNINIDKIINLDIDPECLSIASTVNKRQEMAGKFRHIIGSMEDFDYTDKPTIVINTSCEHITQDQYDRWLNNIPVDSLIVLQSNDYNIPEHIRLSSSIENFIQQSNLKTIIFSGELELPLYKRFMIIGKKDV